MTITKAHLDLFDSQRLREEIKESGLTIYAIAKRSGVTRQTIHNFLNGRTTISVVNLKRIYKAINSRQ